MTQTLITKQNITIKFGLLHEIEIPINIEDVVYLKDAISIAAHKLGIDISLTKYNVILNNMIVEPNSKLIEGSIYKVLYNVGYAG